MRLKFAASKREITPPVGTHLSGFIARLKPSEGVAEPIHVRALVASDGVTTGAVVQADLLGFPRWQVAAVRQFARQELGIPEECLLLSATHTHSGPGMVPLRGCPMAPYTYQCEVVEKIEAALSEAHSRQTDGSMELATVPYSLGINRREETPNGVVLGVAPEKPRPRQLEAARIRTDRQEVLLFSHACHPYVLGGESLLISGDFPSLACSELEKGTSTVAMFLNGCAGNISPESRFQGIEKARDEGKRLAKAVQKACESAHTPNGDSLRGETKTVHLPYVPLPTEKAIDALASQEERVVRPDEKGNLEIQRRLDAALKEWAGLMKRVIQLTWPLEPLSCEVQALQIGPLILLGIGGEPFFEIGENIRDTSRGSVVWPLGYANTYCGYIPTRREYPGGGYEVNDSWKYIGLWKVDETCEDRVAEAGSAVLAKVLAKRS